MKKLLVCLLTLGSVISCANAQVKPALTKAPAKTTAKPLMTKAAMKNLLDSFSYAAGVNIANNMKQQGIDKINTELMMKAIDDVFKNNTPALDAQQCNASLQTQMGIFNKKKDEENKKKNAAIKAQGEAFLAENKKRKEVITLEDGLQYEILKSGDANGLKPTAQDTVVVNYVGTLTDGKEFDASRGKPVEFPVGGVIRGWTEILQLMHKGDHWKVYIPSDLAYGERGAGEAIPGGSALVFEITLEDVKPAAIK
ncbi:MAG: FKBP-type peptidyl-prolyl cis-trans isomerase [Ferruginibacter sp.]